MSKNESLDPKLYPQANIHNLSFSLLSRALLDKTIAIDFVNGLNDWAYDRIGRAIADGDRESERYALEIYEETELSVDALYDVSQEEIRKAWMERLQENQELVEGPNLIRSFLSDEEALR